MMGFDLTIPWLPMEIAIMCAQSSMVIAHPNMDVR